MKPIEPWKALVFVGVLVFLATVINLTLAPNTYGPVQTTSPSQAPSVPPPLLISAPQPVEAKAPLPSKPQVWPSDFKPTKSFRIPDPEHPVTGVFDLTIHPHEDIEMKMEAWWYVTIPGQFPSKLEHAVEEGDGFKVNEEVDRSRKRARDNGETPWWAKSRIVRYRPKPGTSEDIPIRFIINKTSAEETKPLPPIPPQRFGNLEVAFRGLQGVGNNNKYVTVDLELRNTSKESSIGVAFHGPPKNPVAGPEVPLPASGSLLDSGGKEYSCEEVSGLGVMNANPRNLTELRPDEARRVSLRYRTSWAGSPDVTSFRMQMELVINDSYRRDQYSYSSRIIPNTLPFGCRIENLLWTIPIRR